MTREQAQEAFRQNLREFPSLLEQTDRAIDLYVALGMLKLDEPKSANEMARAVIEREVCEWNMVRSGSVRADNVASGMLAAFDLASLKIVFK